jgi:acetoin utilization protein AcuB
MIVRDRMTTRVEVVAPDEPVEAVREVLRRRRIRHMPVVAAGRLIGIVSDRDVHAAVPADTLVEAVMTPSPATTTPGTPVEVAAAVLRLRKIGALPVVEGETLVGIVSESDLLGALVDLCKLLDPTSVLEIECAGDPGAASRARTILERHGGRVAWTTAVGTHGGQQRVALRVRMPLGHAPEQLLEEAGFTVLSCVMTESAVEPGSRVR